MKIDAIFTPQRTSQTSAVVRVLGNSAFRSLWIGQLASSLAVSVTMFVLALRIYQLTGSSTAVSALFLTFGVPAFLFAMASGAIVDHFDKRTILILADVARAVVAVLFLFAFGNIVIVYALAFFYAFITQFATPSEAPTIPRLVGNSDLVTANSIYSFTFYTSLAIGSLLSGPLLRFFGPIGVFVFLCAMFIVAAISVSRIPKEAGKKKLRSLLGRYSLLDMAGKVLSSMSEGVAYIKTRQKLLDALLLLMGTQVTLAILATLGPAFAVQLLEVDVHDASLYLVGPAVVGIVVGALWVGNNSKAFTPSTFIQTGVTAAGLLLLIISLTVSLKRVAIFSGATGGLIFLSLILVLFFLLGFANSLLDVPANSVLQHEAEGGMRGRVYGLLTAVVGGLGMLPVLVGGILGDIVGVGKVIFFLGVLIFAYGILRLRYNKIENG